MTLTTIFMTFAVVTQTFNLPPGLISAVCFVESSHVPTAYTANDGGSSSIGVCQLKLATARFLGFKGTEKELSDPRLNIFYSAKYLRYNFNRYHGDVRKAIAAYNAGTHRIDERGQIKNIHYVTKVFAAWAEGR